MERAQQEELEHRLEQWMGQLLRWGVIASALVVLAGGVIYLVRHGGEIPHYRVFTEEPAEFRSLRGIIREAFSLRGRALIQFGLLVLIATPIARVVFSIVGFVRERDYLYVTFTLIVLGALLYSLLAQH